MPSRTQRSTERKRRRTRSDRRLAKIERGLGTARCDFLTEFRHQLFVALVGPSLLDFLRVDRALLRERLGLGHSPLLGRPGAEQEALARVVAALVASIEDHRVVARTRERVRGTLFLAL